MRTNTRLVSVNQVKIAVTLAVATPIVVGYATLVALASAVSAVTWLLYAVVNSPRLLNAVIDATKWDVRGLTLNGQLPDAIVLSDYPIGIVTASSACFYPLPCPQYTYTEDTISSVQYVATLEPVTPETPALTPVQLSETRVSQASLFCALRGVPVAERRATKRARTSDAEMVLPMTTAEVSEHNATISAFDGRKWAENETGTPEVNQVSAPTPATVTTDVRTYRELQSECKARGLKATGTRDALVARLASQAPQGAANVA